MVQNIQAKGFTDLNMSVPEWMESGYSVRFLTEIAEKKGISMTREQAEDFLCDYAPDFSSEIYQATVTAMENAVDEFIDNQNIEEE